MPADLAGKTVVTQTMTTHDLEELRARGIETLVTDFAPLEGRSFATNVMQAVAVALVERPPADIRPEEYVETLLRAGIRPRIEKMGQST